LLVLPAAAERAAARPILWAGGGYGGIEELTTCEAVEGSSCDQAAADGPAFPVGLGIELAANRWFAVQAGVRLLTVLNATQDSWGLAASGLGALRLTPGPAILEFGTGLAWLRASGWGHDFAATAGLLHLAVGGRISDRWRVLGVLEVMPGDGSIGGFIGGMLEIALGRGGSPQ